MDTVIYRLHNIRSYPQVLAIFDDKEGKTKVALPKDTLREKTVTFTNWIVLFCIALGHRIFEAIIKCNNRGLIQIKGVFNADSLTVLRVSRGREDRKPCERCGE